MAVDESEGEGMALNQSSVELLDYRVKQLENERMPHRISAAESMMTQLQADVRDISDANKGFGEKLETAVKAMSDDQLRFMTFARTVLWLSGMVGAAVAAFITFAPTVSKMVTVVAETPGM